MRLPHLTACLAKYWVSLSAPVRALFHPYNYATNSLTQEGWHAYIHACICSWRGRDVIIESIASAISKCIDALNKHFHNTQKNQQIPTSRWRLGPPLPPTTFSILFEMSHLRFRRIVARFHQRSQLTDIGLPALPQRALLQSRQIVNRSFQVLLISFTPLFRTLRLAKMNQPKKEMGAKWGPILRCKWWTNCRW